MPVYTLSAILHNPLFVAPAFGWCFAQLSKTIIYVIVNHEFNWERIIGAGGMPSSHSATVCALCTAAAYTQGFDSVAFPITFFFAFIVMYDAMGVRRETGEQAKVINEMVRQFQHMDEVFSNQTELKEFVGHTPLQVTAGLIIGIVIGYLTCRFLF